MYYKNNQTFYYKTLKTHLDNCFFDLDNYYITLMNSLRCLKQTPQINVTTAYSGFADFCTKLKNSLVPGILAIFILSYLSIVRSISVNKVCFVWVVFFMLFYWVMSGFVFFIKKYLYSKFTTANQRFWKRSLLLFWVIELFLFSIFFYLTINANVEPYFMLDQAQLYKTRLVAVNTLLLTVFPYLLMILFTYFLILTAKWQVFTQNLFWIILITVIFIYNVFNEFYQFFHIVNFYSNVSWIYDLDERVWNLENDVRRTRTLNHYITLLIVLKFWHIVLVFFFWVFFILRTCEFARVRYILLAANLQNFLFLYVFGWLIGFFWLKMFYKHYYTFSYYWFFINFRQLGLLIFFNDLKLVFFSIFQSLWNITITKSFSVFNFFYWNNLSQNATAVFYKNIITTNLLKNLYTL